MEVGLPRSILQVTLKMASARALECFLFTGPQSPSLNQRWFQVRPLSNLEPQ